jgi:carboxypeptidase Q
MKTISSILFLLLLLPLISTAQNNDSTIIRNIFTYCLEQGKGYEWLEHLTTKIGPRLSGSPGAEKAVVWAKEAMEKEQHGRVYLQEVMVPHWVRNDKEQLTVITNGKRIPLSMCSLGGSIATPTEGIRAGVVEVKNFDDLAKLGKEKVAGKIVFFNAPLREAHYHTFHAYGECGKFRWAGAIHAAKQGGVASINRSLTLALDDFPHTGSMGYEDNLTKVPAGAVSTIAANLLHDILKKDPDAQLELIMNCETLPDKLSHNVIAEIKGTQYPDEIIVVGGHLDAWDNGQGAHDDGAGCVQSMELLRIFRDLNIKPKRTIRVVLFMNEENGVAGGKKYAEEAKLKNEKHIAAIESDLGGFTPAGFFSHAVDSTKRKVLDPFKHLFEPYGIFQWNLPGGGVDIDRLKETGTLLIGLQPDSQRYFDYHHTANDTFDKVNRRELHLGAAAMASLVYLLSEYGVE